MVNADPILGGVDGGGSGAPGVKIILPIIPAAITDLPAPSSWSPERDWWQEETYNYTAKDATRKAYKVSRGFRFHCLVTWDYLDPDNRKILVNLLNQTGPRDKYIYFYPHKDDTDFYIECFIVDSNVSKYLAGAPIGYGKLTLEVLGREIYAEIPLTEKRYHLTDSGFAGAYGTTDEIAHFTDSDFAGAYLANDKVGYFCDSRKEVSSG